MWLPTPIYERIPVFMLLAGVLFVGSAFYIGFHMPISYFYCGVGVACLFWGAVVFALRAGFRKGVRSDASHEVRDA